ncbi:hypothetical protein DFH06DRAFT_1130082 [Mycena polygramma]|nr:hypothetical protein DFH06DRAFT_1130082 [Mycena polygramma]
MTFTSHSEEFLESSQRLSPGELAVANEVISAGERRISDIDASIARVRAELDKLTMQREANLEQVLQYKKATRPMRRLPPEIVSQFLAATLPDLDPDDLGQTPWQLGHVCSYWRAVALATPILWRDVIILRTRSYPLEKLETQLARSSNLPLRVMFWSPFSPLDSHATNLLQTLIDSSLRWTVASLEIHPQDFVHLDPLRGSIPYLRYLRIGVAPDDYRGVNRFMDSDSESEDSDNPFEIAPALRDVTLDDTSGLPRPLVLPFRQLTRLKASTDYASHVEMLQKSPNLEMANLEFTDDPVGAMLPMIRLPHLRRLYISAQPFLNQLQLPTLEEIYAVDVDPTPILSLVSRCPTIKLKTLRMAWCTPRHISQILEACPTVQTLGVQVMPNDKGNDFLVDLTVRNNMCVGPSLHTIAIGIDRATINYDLFIKMAESRRRVPAKGGPCCRLRSVELLAAEGGRRLNAAQQQRLDALKRKGLQVSVLEGAEASAELMNWRI